MIIYDSKLAKLLLKNHTTITIMFIIFTIYKSLTQRLINHENIHIRQWSEISILSFCILGLLNHLSLISLLFCLIIYYIIYGLEYLIRFLIYYFTKDLSIKDLKYLTYKTISFEAEAFNNQDRNCYFKLFGWIRYILK